MRRNKIAEEDRIIGHIIGGKEKMNKRRAKFTAEITRNMKAFTN